MKAIHTSNLGKAREIAFQYIREWRANIKYDLFSLFFLFDSWQLTKQSPGAIRPLSQQSPVLSVMSFSEICLDTHIHIFLIVLLYSREPIPTSPWSRTRQRPAWNSNSASVYVPMRSHLKPPKPPSHTIRLSKFNNQSRCYSFFRPSILIPPALPLANLRRASLSSPSFQHFFFSFLSRYDFRLTDRIAAFLVDCETTHDRPHPPTIPPVVHGPLLTRLVSNTRPGPCGANSIYSKPLFALRLRD